MVPYHTLFLPFLQPVIYSLLLQHGKNTRGPSPRSRSPVLALPSPRTKARRSRLRSQHTAEPLSIPRPNRSRLYTSRRHRSHQGGARERSGRVRPRPRLISQLRRRLRLRSRSRALRRCQSQDRPAYLCRSVRDEPTNELGAAR